MNNVFTEADYEAIHKLVFSPDYPGYKPEVKEIPNGDGNIDHTKRYAHIALKYLLNDSRVHRAQRRELMPYLDRAHGLAAKMSEAAGIPFRWGPDIRYGALRILDYPAGAGSHRHEDFDLFTVMCYRDRPELFVSEDGWVSNPLARMRKLNTQCHLGEIGTKIGLGRATPHEVLPGTTRQRSIVYFALPAHDLTFEDGQSVGAWLTERVARSRTK
jgi:hypothetical protein